MKNVLNFPVIALLFILGFVSCKDDDKGDKIVEPITISEEIEALGSYWGNSSSDVAEVLINTQGGPVPQLLDSELREILGTVDDSKTKDLLIFNVHQAQTKNPAEFETAITFEEAKTYDQQSVADLAKVIKYFKARDMKVHVLGISFGAFMIQDLLAKEGVDVADDYLIMVGRLDMPEVIWESFSEGNIGGFENGVTPYVAELNGAPNEKNMSRLAAGLGYKRYTEELSAMDLSKVTYVYGELDEEVGQLSQAEIDFLNSKNAKVIRVPNADHSDAIEDAVNEQFGNAFGL